MYVGFLTGGSVIGVMHVIFQAWLGNFSFANRGVSDVSVSCLVAGYWGWDWEFEIEVSKKCTNR